MLLAPPGKVVPSTGASPMAASPWMAATNFALAGAKLKRSLKPKDHLFDLENMKPEETILRIGDSISLFSIEGNGYVSSEGFIDSDCQISTIGQDKRIPDHFSDCVFRICPRNKYDAHTALNDQLDAVSRTRASIGSRQFDPDPEAVHLEKKLLQLKKHEVEEESENHAEFGRLAGNTLSYGQTVQLLHVKSNKFVTVTSKEIAEIETHCLRVYLDPMGNEGSWFTLLPRFKTMAEGENIHLGDQIILESKCYNSIFLHVSKETMYQKREVNATTEKSSWRVIPFAPFVPESDSFLKAGDVIRMFHKEAEGYLTNELPDDDFVDEDAEKEKPTASPDPQKDEVYLQLFAGSGQVSDDTKKAPQNSNALWQIELDRPNRGGVVQYETFYRFKHIATGHYLAAYPKPKEKNASPISLRRRDKDESGAGGMLKLNVPQLKRRMGLSLGSASDEEEEELVECTFTTVKEFSSSATLFTVHPLGATIDTDKRVKLESYMRIRHVNTKCYLHACKEAQEKNRMKLIGREERLDEDAFAVVPASREEIDNLLRAVGQVAILKQCVAKLAQGEKMDFTKTGLTVSKGILAMDTKRVIGVLKDLIISCTISSTGDDDVLSREGIPIPANQDLLREQHVIAIMMNLLQQTFSQKAIQRKAYERAENYTLFIIAQHAYKLLKQILKKNPTNRMAMSKYVNYFQKRMTFPPCTDTLMELFRDNYNLLKNIADDQVLFFIFRLRNTGRKSSYIKFLSILCRCGDEPLMKNQNFICERLIVENHDLLISIKMIEETGEVMVQPSSREPWTPIEEFMNEGEKRDDKQIYFTRTIKLLSNLCLGRNNFASTKISRVMTYPLVLRCMTNPDLPFTLRASFCLLMQHLYVDVEPYKSITLVNYTRVWSDLEQKPQLGGFEDASTRDSRQARSDLCKYVGYYIADNSAQSVNAITHNKLTLAMVVLMKRMFELGFWMQSEDTLRDLIVSILALLDPSTEVSEGEQNPLFKQDDRTIWIMKTKYNLCSLMDMFFNLRLDRRLTELLIILRKQMDGSGVPTDLTKISKATEEKIDEASKVWSDFLGESERGGQQSDILERTLRYMVMCDYTPLSLAAGNLLVRQFSQRFELLTELQQVQILVTDKNVKTFQFVAQKMDDLKSFLEKNGSDSLIVPIIDKFARLCVKGNNVNVHNQRILKNLEAHKVAIELLHLPFNKPLFFSVFQFLAAFCKDNADNQGALFEYLDFFLKMMGKDLYVAVTINEMFHNNRALCSQITEVQIRKIVNAIETNKLPRYIQVLMTLIMPNDIPLRRNQNLVLKMLMEKQQTTLVLFNDPESIEYRNSLIKKRNYEKEDSMLKFHCMQIELITKCSLGKIYEAEVRCQSLYSMGQIKRQLTDPVNLRSIKKTFTNFLEEVYFLTQKPKNAIELDPQLWTIFSEHYTKEFIDLTNLLNQGERDEGALDYVVTGIIPFLVNYFGKYYNRKDATIRHKVVADYMVDGLTQLFYAKGLTHAQRVEVGKCIDAMNRPEVNIRGTDPDKTDKASKEWRVLIESPPEKETKASVVAVDTSQEEKVIQGIQQFVKYFKEKKIFGIEQELQNLAQIFRKHLDTFTKKLIELLKNCDSGTQQELTWVTLRTLNILLEKPLADALKSKNKDVQSLVNMQNKLNNMGATNLILHLISSSQNEDRVYHQALKLGIAILHGGNEEVQRYMLQCFINGQEEGFFPEIRSRIRRSIIEIKEKQQFYFRLLERKRAQEHQRTEANAILFRNDKFGAGIDNELLAYLKQTEGTYPESGFIRKILRFLQLLCEGHNLEMQNYLRYQTETSNESYDLISETAAYLEAVEREIDATNIKIATQLFTTLTEYCQGPCAENQVALMRTKLVESANWVLALPDDHPLCHSKDVNKLKKEAVVTLLSLLEGNQNPKVPRQMLMTLNFSVMEKTLDTIFPVKITQQNLSTVDEEAKDVKRAFLYYFLIKTLADHDKDNHKHLNRLLEGCNGALALRKGTASIEVVRDNKLERIYFQRPRICKQLSPMSKKNLLHNVNRENQASKIEDFFDQNDGLIQEMMHRDSLADNLFLNNLSQGETFLKNLSFAFTIIINLLIVWSFTAPKLVADDETEEGAVVHIDVQHPTVEPMISALLTLFGVCQIGLAAILLFIEYEFGFRLAWKQAVAHRKNRKEKDNGADNHEDNRQSPKWWRGLDLPQLWSAARKSAIFYFLAYLVFAVCGVVISPFFFAFHLLDIGARSKELKYVISSVTQNGKSIILTAILALIVIYIYTIFGFLFFRDKFVQDDVFICESMLMCFVNVVNYGLRSGGGVGDLLKPPMWGDPETPYRILYDSTFFFVVIVILLNIIFGIIIDTFGELRNREETIESDIKNNCFICGIDNITFDRASEAGFEKHWKYDHNMWNYLYFRVHLNIKDSTEYTGPEQYIAEKLAVNDLSFIPNQKAMCLGAKQEEDEEKAQELILRVETMSSALQKTTDETVSRLGESMEKRYNTLNASLIELAASSSSRSTAVETKLEGRVENVEKHISALEKKLTTYLDNIEKAIKKEEKRHKKASKEKEERKKKREKQLKEKEKEKRRREEEARQAEQDRAAQKRREKEARRRAKAADLLLLQLQQPQPVPTETNEAQALVAERELLLRLAAEEEAKAAQAEAEAQAKKRAAAEAEAAAAATAAKEAEEREQAAAAKKAETEAEEKRRRKAAEEEEERAKAEAQAKQATAAAAAAQKKTAAAAAKKKKPSLLKKNSDSESDTESSDGWDSDSDSDSDDDDKKSKKKPLATAKPLPPASAAKQADEQAKVLEAATAAAAQAAAEEAKATAEAVAAAEEEKRRAEEAALSQSIVPTIVIDAPKEKEAEEELKPAPTAPKKGPAGTKKKPGLVKKNSDSESDTESSDGWDSDSDSDSDGKNKKNKKKPQEGAKAEGEKPAAAAEPQHPQAEPATPAAAVEPEQEAKAEVVVVDQKAEQPAAASTDAAPAAVSPEPVAQTAEPAAQPVQATEAPAPKAAVAAAAKKKPSLVKKNSDSESDTESSDSWDSDSDSDSDDEKKNKKAKPGKKPVDTAKLTAIADAVVAAPQTAEEPATQPAEPAPSAVAVAELQPEAKKAEEKEAAVEAAVDQVKPSVAEVKEAEAIEKVVEAIAPEPAKAEVVSTEAAVVAGKQTPAAKKKPGLVKKNSDSESDTESSDGWDSDSDSDDEKKKSKNKKSKPAVVVAARQPEPQPEPAPALTVPEPQPEAKKPDEEAKAPTVEISPKEAETIVPVDAPAEATKAPTPATTVAAAKKKPSLVKKNSDSESDTESSDSWDSDDDDDDDDDDDKKKKPKKSKPGTKRAPVVVAAAGTKALEEEAAKKKKEEEEAAAVAAAKKKDEEEQAANKKEKETKEAEEKRKKEEELARRKAAVKKAMQGSDASETETETEASESDDSDDSDSDSSDDDDKKKKGSAGAKKKPVVVVKKGGSKASASKKNSKSTNNKKKEEDSSDDDSSDDSSSSSDDDDSTTEDEKPKVVAASRLSAYTASQPDFLF